MSLYWLNSSKTKSAIPPHIVEILESLYTKHDSDQYMIGRINSFISTTLQTNVTNAQESRIVKQKQKLWAKIHAESASNKFMNANNYSYLPETDIFINYNGIKFTTIREDDIVHSMLGVLSKQVGREDTDTLVWKHKTKTSILKQIKSVSPLTIIPESQTIQEVIGMLTPSTFSTKNEAKYFLILIGEMIVSREKFGLTKEGSMGSEFDKLCNIAAAPPVLNTIITSSQIKYLLQQIHNGASTFLGVNNISANFKYKYHDHDYANTRILDTVDAVNQSHELLKTIGSRILDVLCVSAHYAMRFDSADSFIEQCDDDELIDRTFFLRDHSQIQIVNIFKEEYTQPNPNWKFRIKI